MPFCAYVRVQHSVLCVWEKYSFPLDWGHCVPMSDCPDVSLQDEHKRKHSVQAGLGGTGPSSNFSKEIRYHQSSSSCFYAFVSTRVEVC